MRCAQTQKAHMSAAAGKGMKGMDAYAEVITQKRTLVLIAPRVKNRSN